MAKSRRALPVLPALPSKATARRLSACFCGCGGVTGGTFVPGHDSKLKSWVLSYEFKPVESDAALADFPNILKRVHEVAALRASGTNVSFMRNVELPEVEVEQNEEKVG